LKKKLLEGTKFIVTLFGPYLPSKTVTPDNKW